MTNIKQLADRAAAFMRTGETTSWGSAARRAVRASGITYQPDVRRISKEVLRELQRRSVWVRRRKKKRAPPHKEEQLLLPLVGGSMRSF